MTSSALVGPGLAMEEALREAVVEAREADPLTPLNVLVPSNLLAVWLRRKLAVELGGLVNVRFLTFIALAKEVAGRSYERVPLSSRPHDHAAIRDALSKGTGYFDSVSSQSGLHSALLNALEDLDNGAILPGDLRTLANRREGETGELAKSDAERIRSLAAVAEAREKLLAGNFQTPRHLMELAANSAQTWAAGQAPPLLVYGFHDFTELQIRLIAQIATVSRLVVYLIDEHGNESRYLQPTIERLEKAGVAIEHRASGASGMQRLASALFRGPESTEAPVHFTSAPSELVEVEEVTRQLLGLLEIGVSPDDVAIVHHGDPYPRMLAEVLDRAGLQYFLVGGEALAATRYGTSMLLLLDLVGSPVRRADLMEWISFVSFDAQPGARPGNWEWITRRAAIVEGEAQWKERLGAYLSELRRELDRAADVSDEKEWLPRLISDTGQLLEFVSNLFADLAALDVTATYAEHVGRLEDLCDKYLAADAPAAERCRETLERLRDLDLIVGPQPFGVFREALKLDLNEEVLSHGRLGRGHVLLGRPRDLRGMRYRHVFVVGLAERSFPPPPSVDSILLERERRLLGRSTGSLVRSRGQLLDEERLLFANLVGASGELYLSFPRYEMERARPRFASPFYLAAAEAMSGRNQDWQLENLPNHHRVPDSQPSPVATGAALWVEEVDLSVVMSTPSPGPREWNYLDASTPHFRRLRNAVRCRAYSKLFTRYDGMVRKPESQATVAAFLNDRLLSPTALETYANCPQKFLMKQLLRVEVLDEPENVAELSPLERGTIIHDILQQFYEELDRSHSLPLERGRAPEYRGLLEELADREFARAEERGVTGHLVGWKAYRRRLLEDLVRFLENELDNLSPDLTPTHFEFAFGSSPESPPVTISAEGGLRLAFGGRIDRIDSSPDRARVIDYKSGKTLQARFKDSVSFEGGEQLQLPIYLLAAARALNLPEEAVDAAYYHVNRQAAFRTVNLRGENFRKRRGEFDYLVRGLVDQIQRGVFVPQTRAGVNCRYCDFKTVCPAAVQRQQERKQEDESMLDFLELKDIK